MDPNQESPQPHQPVYENVPTQTATPTEPVTVPQPPVVPASHNPIGLVLQWLTYAFWGWTVFAMSILTATVITSIVDKTDTSGFTPYGLAAVLVLLPISIITDYFYSKQEPLKKTGASSVVMVIHAVLFALFTIGSLIAVVVSIISMATNSESDSHAPVIALTSALVITALYAVTFVRVVRPPIVPHLGRLYVMFMTLAVGIIAVAAIVGPFATARSTRDDRRIESASYDYESQIRSYTDTNERLPASLDEIGLNGKAYDVYKDGLVTYRPNTKPVEKPQSDQFGTYGLTNYYYSLCFTFKEASSESVTTSGDSNYDSYLDVTRHTAGQNCYNVKLDSYQ